MDVVVLKPSLLVILMALFLSFSIIQPSSAQDSSRNGSLNNNVTDVVAYPSASPPPSEKSRFSPFKPSIAVIVGVLTTMFSVTLLLLLYAKHCKRGGSFVLGIGDVDHYQVNSSASTGVRKNSGIDRGVVESLPVFRFSALSGHNKEGLECAVCLSRFESAEVLRLLPKCKHAFHVECVDTWLDGHSTCPLCRYRVDPEDVLLIDVQAPPPPPASDVESGRHSLLGRLSGRYSSAGEKVFQTVDTTSYRRSLDSVAWRKKDSARKDGLLLSRGERNNAVVVSENRGRFEHRIVVSPACGGTQYQRWSDFQPSDLLYLQSEMIMSDCRRFSSASGSRPSVSRQQLQLWRNNGKGQGIYIDTDGDANGDGSGSRIVINSRSVSEITGISRFSNDNNRGSNDTRQRQRQQAGLLSRWLAWVPQLRPTY